MEDFLENLRARYEPLIVRDGPFEQILGVGLVRVWGTHYQCTPPTGQV